MSPTCPDGIPADSDVAGIGTRITIYAQAGFASLPLFAVLAMFALRLPRDAIMDMYTRSRNSAWSFYLSGVAMLVTSYIKRSDRTLSPYHAAVVLNLNWIIVLILLTSYCTMLHVALTDVALRFSIRVSARKGLPKLLRMSAAAGSTQRSSVIDTYIRTVVTMLIYLILIGALGITLFHDPYSFSANSECVDDTVFWIFGSRIAITRRAISRAWRGVYTVMLIPGINFTAVVSFYSCVVFFIWLAGFVVMLLTAGVLVTIFCLCPIAWLRNLIYNVVRGFSMLLSRSNGDIVFGITVFNFSSVLLLAFLIASNEKMIGANPVASGEMVWGFGQILSVFLLVSPAYDAIQDIRHVYSIWKAQRRKRSAMAGRDLEAAPFVRLRANTV